MRVIFGTVRRVISYTCKITSFKPPCDTNLCKTKPGINYETLDSKNTLARLTPKKINALMKLKHRTMKLFNRY